MPRDYPGSGTAFRVNFDPARGDLVYGRRERRAEYKDTLPEEKLALVNLATTFWTIDQYNNNLGLFPLMTEGEWRERERGARTGVGLAANRNLDNSLGVGPDTVPVTGTQLAYVDAMAASRFHPTTLFATRHTPATQAKLRKEGFHTPDHPDPDRMATQYKIVRRACKFGIQWVADRHRGMQSEAFVHFILDGLIEEDAVLVKPVIQGGAGQRAVSITNSELASVYRNWDDLAGYVVFYRNHLAVPAPWENDLSIFHNYGRARYDKHRRALMAAKTPAAAPRYRPSRMLVETLERLAAGLASAARNLPRACAVLKCASRVVAGELDMAGYLREARARPTVLALPPAEPAPDRLIPLVKQALVEYRKSPLLHWKSDVSKAAAARLDVIVERGPGERLRRALHWYLEIDPLPAQMDFTGPLTVTSRLAGLLEAAYRRWLFG